MPNWVRNKVVFYGSKKDIREMREFMADDEEQFSFNKLIPMDQELLKTDAWYSWRLEHWGTKWNCSEVKWIDDEHLVFNTAWNPPTKIFSALSERFPHVRFNVDFADEDLGQNCGTIYYYLDEKLDTGELIRTFGRKNRENRYDAKNIRFACRVWDLDPEEVLAEWNEDE